MSLTRSDVELSLVKLVIKSILVTHPSSIPIHQLLRDYKESENADIPYKKFGFRDVMSFLKQLKDVCFLERRGTIDFVGALPDEETAHVHNLVTKQKSRTRQNGTTKTSSFARRYPLHHTSQPTNAPSFRTVSNHYAKPLMPSTLSSNFYWTTTSTRTSYPQRPLGNSHPTTQNGSGDHTTVPAPYYSTVVKMGSVAPPSQPPPSRPPQLQPGTIPDCMKLALDKVLHRLKERPTASLDDVIHMYTDECPQESLEDWFSSRHDVLDYVARHPPPGHTIFITAGDRNNYQLVFKRSPLMPVPQTSPSRAPSPRLEPKNKTMSTTVLPYTNRLSVVALPPDHQSVYFPVYVAQVHSPGHFYVQLRSKETSVKLEEIMNELDIVYNGQFSDRYSIASADELPPGSLCAARYPTVPSGDWHRGVVLPPDNPSLPNGTHLNIYYCDYGTVDQVPIGCVRALRDDFVHFPAQALKAQLAHVRPKDGDTWSKAAKEILFAMSRNDRVLMCLVEGRDGDTLKVNLCDTRNSEDDKYVMDALIEAGYAVVDDSELTRSTTIEHVGMPVTDRPTGDGESFLSSSDEDDDDNGACLKTKKTPNAGTLPMTSRRVKIELLRTGHALHIVRHDQQLYVPSGDICALMGWTTSCLEEKLDEKTIGISTAVTVHRNEHELLFKEMAALQVPHIFLDSTEVATVPSLVLYPIANILDILHLFECSSKQMLSEVRCVLEWYKSERVANVASTL